MLCYVMLCYVMLCYVMLCNGSFVEIGSVTPLPQAGNPKPRVFRLEEDRAIINRYGFNSHGAEVVRARLENYDKKYGIIGVNLGKNKDTLQPVADYVQGISTLGKYGDYIVINVSSPNTPGLRSLQGREVLRDLLTQVKPSRERIKRADNRKIPLLVKIAPDLTESDKKDIANVVTDLGVDGLIISNTTIARPNTLISPFKKEEGGLSGSPLLSPSTKLIKEMFKLTHGKIPIIGVGGVSTGRDAYLKIRSGASLVQIYSSFAFEGPLVVRKIKDELTSLLVADGYKSVNDAIGVDANK